MKAPVLIFSFCLLVLNCFSFPTLPFLSASPSQPHIIQGKVQKGSTFSQSLSNQQIPYPLIRIITSSLKDFIDFKTMREGTYQLKLDSEGKLIHFALKISPYETYELQRIAPDKFFAHKKKTSMQTKLVKIEGEIDSSLSRAIIDCGETNALTMAIVNILAWQIDFSRETKKGDCFTVVVEKKYDGERFLGYGFIHALEYRSSNKIIRGIKFRDNYYDELGNSLGRAYLEPPLKFRFISSKFNPKRKHPILGGIRPHLGIDYAAPKGTPVWTVARGVIASCGWVNGYGKQVVVRHTNNYRTYYSHLSRYGLGIKEGVRVKRRQIIGYVGTSGFATGPHLDFRIEKDGRFIDPLKKVFPLAQKIENDELNAFSEQKEKLLTFLAAND
jgi:murein DD-endopeptidase MepM/ murein hydrolase activator NlpD